MDIRFISEKKITRYFFGVTSYDERLWYSTKNKVWQENLDQSGGSNFYKCKTLKAALRHIRKHPELKGKRMLLSSKFVGHDVIITVGEND